MSEAILPPDEAGAGAEVEAVGSAVEQGADEAAAGSQTAPDPNDYEARIRSDPEFAIAEVKRQQSSASKAHDALRKAQLAVQIAEQLGNGDVKAGAETALQELVKFRQLQQNPKVKSLIERVLSGGDIGDTIVEDEYEDPMQKELAELRGNQSRLQQQVETQLATERYERAVKEYFETPIGKALTPEERADFFASLDATIKTWLQTPNGRAQLQNFDVSQMRRLGAAWLDSKDLLPQMGERMARAKAASLQKRATDSPSRSTTIGPDQSPHADNATEAWEIAKRRMGMAR